MAAPQKPETPAAPVSTRGASAIVRGGLLSMLAMLALGLTRLVHGSLVNKATSVSTYGLVGSMLAITTIASLLLPGGAASAASKFISFHRGAGNLAAARGVHRFLSMVSVAGAVVLGVAAALGAGAYYDLSAGQAVSVGVLTAAFSVYSVDKAVLYGFARVPAYVRLELSCSVLSIGATIAVVATGATAYLAPLAIGYSAFVLGTRWVLRTDVRGERAPFDHREVLGYIALASTGTVASFGFLQGTQLLAGLVATRADAAYFAAGVVLVGPMYFLPRALQIALFPTMAEAHGAGDVEGVRTSADVSTRALFVLLAPAFVGGILVAREVLVLFGKAAYADGAVVLQLLLAATYLAVVQVAAVNALSSGSRRQVRVPVFSAVCGALVGLALVAVLGRPYGATGVGVAYLVGTAVSASGPLVAVWRLYAMPWRGPVVRSLAVVGAALGAGLALNQVRNPWVDVLVGVAAAALAVVVLGRDILGVLPSAVRRRLPAATRRLTGVSSGDTAEKGPDAPQ